MSVSTRDRRSKQSSRRGGVEYPNISVAGGKKKGRNMNVVCNQLKYVVCNLRVQKINQTQITTFKI